MVDFYNGLIVLKRLAAPGNVMADRQSVLDQLIAFEGAYKQLVQLHEAGKLDAGGADFSEENLARVKRIVALLRGDDRPAMAQEVRALAEQCVLGHQVGEA
jgi:hypothetical protein